MNEQKSRVLDKFKQQQSPINIISVGCTWVDGRLLFKHKYKWSRGRYGLCHYASSVFAIAPIDFLKATMITTIKVAPLESYCERAFSCLNFTCWLNRFNRDIFLFEFGDLGAQTLGLPNNMGSKPLWFSTGKYTPEFWKKFLLQPEGGTVDFNQDNKEVGD